MLLKNPAGFFAHQFVSLFVRYVLLIVPGKKTNISKRFLAQFQFFLESVFSLHLIKSKSTRQGLSRKQPDTSIYFFFPDEIHT